MSELLPEPSENTDSVPNGDTIAVGQWYWVACSPERLLGDFEGIDETSGSSSESPGIVVHTSDSTPYPGRRNAWLGCVVHVGSNYIELRSPHIGTHKSRYLTRVHFEDYWTTLEHEPNADAVLDAHVTYFQQRSASFLRRIQAVHSSLGLLPFRSTPGQAHGEANALVTMSGQPDVKQYELDLVKARDNTLPALFSAVSTANANLANWMSAKLMAAEALVEPLKEQAKHIEDRLFSVSLYAGLTEQVQQCCPGQAAPRDEKLHVLQRCAFADEEAVFAYRAGGMEFAQLSELDKWISEPENRDRLLPFPKTLLAMRVRREKKERGWDGKAMSLFVLIDLKDVDQHTFLYIRNGEQIWRLSCDMDFGEMIFPDKSLYDIGRPQMMSLFGNRVDKIISKDRFDELEATYNDLEEKSRQWESQQDDGSTQARNPYRGHGTRRYIDGIHFDPSDWSSVDPGNVYYDEAMSEIESKLKEFNRVAVLIQGLFDRTSVLAPHAPVQSWTPEGFARSIKLVYDGAYTIDNGSPPDFEEYRARCNAELKIGSIVVGQEAAWLKREAERFNATLSRQGRDGRLLEYRPPNNPGPGLIASVEEIKSKGAKVVFRWSKSRKRQASLYSSNAPLGDSITVPVADLFNISAYQPGDFRRFYQDHRTRREYLKWAPLLLAAEDYHAGHMATSTNDHANTNQLNAKIKK